jgi:hypothetical protein
VSPLWQKVHVAGSPSLLGPASKVREGSCLWALTSRALSTFRTRKPEEADDKEVFSQS